ncbi:hypothetical protein RRG08_050996 [Elysia crispata]|uniref:Uncharacterized protein n=1 Tax=Elysia crispata TaxID=231223 RepID=A0AAE0YXP9_9GAST|nr:hypothetical protein RRG08_050996 [Elysia crispata]
MPPSNLTAVAGANTTDSVLHECIENFKQEASEFSPDFPTSLWVPTITKPTSTNALERNRLNILPRRIHESLLYFFFETVRVGTGVGRDGLLAGDRYVWELGWAEMDYWLETSMCGNWGGQRWTIGWRQVCVGIGVGRDGLLAGDRYVWELGWAEMDYWLETGRCGNWGGQRWTIGWRQVGVRIGVGRDGLLAGDR